MARNSPSQLARRVLEIYRTPPSHSRVIIWLGSLGLGLDPVRSLRFFTPDTFIPFMTLLVLIRVHDAS